MSSYLRSDDFVESVKKRATVPTSQITFTDEDILRFANEDMTENMVPLILAVREEFFVKDIEIIPDTVSATQERRLQVPERAIGSKIRLATPVSGGIRQGPLAFIPLEHITYRQFSSGAGANAGIYTKGNYMYFVSSAASFIISYYFRPSSMVLLERAAKIESIDRDTGVIQVDDVPSNIEALTAVDFNQTKPGHEVYSFDVNVLTSNPLTNQLTFLAADIPDDLSAGDYICTAGECVIPQIPTDLHNMLAQATACKILEAINDQKGLASATRRLEKMESKLLNLIENRIEAPGKKVVNIGSLLYRTKYNAGSGY